MCAIEDMCIVPVECCFDVVQRVGLGQRQESFISVRKKLGLAMSTAGISHLGVNLQCI
jgi:hypothetical protein